MTLSEEISPLHQLVRETVRDAASRVAKKMDNDGYLIDSIMGEFEPILMRLYTTSCGHTLSGRLAVRVLRDASMEGYGCVDVRYAVIADNLLDSLSHIEEKNRAKWLEGWLKSFADRETVDLP